MPESTKCRGLRVPCRWRVQASTGGKPCPHANDRRRCFPGPVHPHVREIEETVTKGYAGHLNRQKTRFSRHGHEPGSSDHIPHTPNPGCDLRAVSGFAAVHAHRIQSRAIVRRATPQCGHLDTLDNVQLF